MTPFFGSSKKPDSAVGTGNTHNPVEHSNDKIREYGRLNRHEEHEIINAVRGGHGATGPAKQAWLKGNLGQAETTVGYGEKSWAARRKGMVSKSEVADIVDGMKEAHMFRDREIKEVEHRLKDAIED